MSFFDKLKTGMSEAGSKAKVLVEVNKLKLINVSKQNEINGLYKEIGEKVTLSAELGQELQIAYFSEQLEKIAMLKTEIEQNQLKIANLSDDKQCPNCQRMIPIDAKQCPHCNNSFLIEEQVSIEPSYIDLPVQPKDKQGDDDK